MTGCRFRSRGSTKEASLRQRRRRAGLTLIEALVVLAIFGALLCVGTPAFVNAMERAYKRQTRNVLLMIYAGEQAYQVLNDVYYDADATGNSWERLGMDNPNPSDGSILYTVDVGGLGTSATFTAKATRQKGPKAGLYLTLDHNQAFGGTWLPL